MNYKCKKKIISQKLDMLMQAMDLNAFKAQCTTSPTNLICVCVSRHATADNPPRHITSDADRL